MYVRGKWEEELEARGHAKKETRSSQVPWRSWML